MQQASVRWEFEFSNKANRPVDSDQRQNRVTSLESIDKEAIRTVQTSHKGQTLKEEQNENEPPKSSRSSSLSFGPVLVAKLARQASFDRERALSLRVAGEPCS